LILVLVSIHPALCLIRRTKRGKLGILIAGACTAWAVYYVAPNISFHRLATMGEEIARGDMNGRGAIWNNAMNLFWENPVFGIGAGAFAGAVSGRFNTVAHNTYIGVLVEHGMVGLAIFLAIVIGLLVRTRRYPPDERLLWRVVIGSWMVLITSLSWENREFTWLIWGLCSSSVAPMAKPKNVLLGGSRYAA